jgi:hypothetical protein
MSLRIFFGFQAFGVDKVDENWRGKLVIRGNGMPVTRELSRLDSKFMNQT